jgi:hypothetical protein
MPSQGDPSCRFLEIVCHSPGHLTVEWDRVFIVPKDTSIDWKLVERSGRASFLTTPETEFPLEFDRPVLPIMDITPQEIGVSLRSLDEEPSAISALDIEVQSENLEVELKIVKGPTIQVRVKAKSPIDRGRIAELQFRAKTKGRQVLLRKLIPLDLEGNLAGAWESTSEDLRKISEPATVFIRLLPTSRL